MRSLFAIFVLLAIGGGVVVIGAHASVGASNPQPKARSQIVFHSGRDGDADIYVMNADGIGQTKLTNNAAQDGFPSWSPDGSKIAFDGTSDGDREIYVMSADGSGIMQLTSNTASDGDPAWSPDGSKIAFWSDRDGNREIYTMNAGDGSGQTNRTNDSGDDGDPEWSPDGSKIVFATQRDGNCEVYSMNASDGSGPTNLTNNAACEGFPIYSPDGAKISFHSDRDGSFEVYVMNPDGSAQTRLTNNPAYDGAMTPFSPDGTKIAFVSSRDGGDFELYVMNANGTGQGRLTASAGHDGGPDWGPPEIVPDSDLDGCLNTAEQNKNAGSQTSGGLRNPLNFWDLFDTPDESNMRDKAVASADSIRVLQRFGANDSGPGTFNRFSDPLSVPNAFVSGAHRANFHPAFDRGPSSGPNSWNLTAADGAIAASDFNRALQQFGHECS